jgi:predicted unusual protein kinase regulating ubiquinone biosynthesis (AarF/ABC1/UbiB family)
MYYLFKDYEMFIDQITKRLASINILYVKFFQAIALNNSLIDEKINNKLLQFTDNVPWTIQDIRLDELIELTNDYNIILPNGYENPINSGMISLVYKGYKRDRNEQVIIKMKRNHIEHNLQNAIENLQTFMYLLSFIPLIKKYQISDLINKNIDIIRHQTNFAEEIKNMIKMRNNCKNLKYVKIPDVYLEISDKYPNFIAMEFIDGLKINQIVEEDYEEYAKQILKFGFVSTVVHGFSHGDLHGGNIIFIKDENAEKYKYKIGVIDFGIIYELDENYRKYTFDLLTKMFEIPARETALKIFNSIYFDPPGIFEQIPGVHKEFIIKFTSEIIEEAIHTSKKANQLQIYQFLNTLTSYLNKSEISNLGIKPSDDFIKTQLVLAMAHGITLTLCKEKFVYFADKVINELFSTNLIN